ncbi:GroES-like protein [Gonapodya prolifera JEL478]|uniref:GroES-like protein n=1 Tax=Gonapodya prolifera (strain JEL478) TaxID=1344416 RepID=A0A138ZYZ0_GONPJ|nr:GroES-like protein [Gonapodya prolifera JEL478]|eukprot:KXS09724.1 GroES-like protein [Gonapodya prolifera JEL478]
MLPAKAHAVITQKTGPANEVLSFEEVPGPVLKPNSVVIKVAAASVNPVDFKFRAGNIAGMSPPKIAGGDVAGTIVASSVPTFAVGDRVFGRTKSWGAHQEYLVHDPSDGGLVKMAPSLPFEEAGGAAIVALTAYYGLVNYGGLLPDKEFEAGKGPRVLIVGASGGVGHVAVQLAKRCLGASFVVGVCSSKNAAFARQMGCDEVVEYDKEEFKQLDKLADLKPEWKGSFDVIYDTVGSDVFYHPLAPLLLRPGAPYTTAAVPVDGAGAKPVSLWSAVGMIGKVGYRTVLGARPYRMVIPDNKEWTRIAGWINEGKVKIHVQEKIPLQEAARAHDLVAGGRVVGKVVLVV